MPGRGVLVMLAVSPAITFAQDSTPISDNSFLIEEAYNQERGVVQHINTFRRLNGGSWAYSFTQEWPLASELCQLSYTVPVMHAEGMGAGIGDVGLNFRYRLLGGDAASVHASPRFSLFLPTGNERRGRGSGSVSVQASLPVSWVPLARLATHWNAGLTLADGPTTPFLGASAVWLLLPAFNLLVETVWTGGDDRSLVLNPGVRWAFNFESGLQIVPGLAYTIGLNEPAGPDGVFLYLSFEHPLN